MRYRGITAVAGAVATLAAASASAQSLEEFYGKAQVRMIIGNAPGGDYDLGGRVAARYMERHLPGNPTIVVQNMPGASGNVAANHLYHVARKDGSVFGSFSRNLPSQAVLTPERIKVDPRRYEWIGASSLPSRVCVAWHTTPVMTAKDLLSKELIVGSTGAGSIQNIVPAAINSVLNTKFRTVGGYKGISEIVVAMERGEVEGVCHLLSVFQTTQADLLQQNKVRVLFNTEESQIDIPGVPSIYQFVKTAEERQLLRFIFSSAEFGRPYVAPPGTEPARVAALRDAFRNALMDPELRAEAERLQLDMSYRSPDALLAIVNDLYETPESTVEKVNALLAAQRK